MSNLAMANTARWLIAFIIIIILHIILAIALMLGWNPLPPSPPPLPAAIMVELAPSPEAPNNTPKPDPAPKEQVASEPSPVEPEPVKEPEVIPEPIEAPNPKVVITKQQPKPIKKTINKPIEEPIKKPKQDTKDNKPKADVTTHASTVSDKPSDKVAAPTTTASSRPSKAQITWQGLLFSRLARYKRYPYEARSKRQEGIATVSITIDSQGQVLAKHIVKSSGYPVLDQETLDLLVRATPLPKPPTEILKGKNSITITIPIRFNLKNSR